jgi:hypothetical protein
LFIVMNEVDQLEAVTICKCGHVDECERIVIRGHYVQ